MRDWGVVRGGVALARPMCRRECMTCGRVVLRLINRRTLPVFCIGCKPSLACNPFLMTGAW